MLNIEDLLVISILDGDDVSGFLRQAEIDIALGIGFGPIQPCQDRRGR